MELVPSEEARAAIRRLVGPSPGQDVPEPVRRCLERPDTRLGLKEARWLRARLAAAGDAGPLHRLLAGVQLVLPAPVTLPRDAELEARCQRLRLEQDERVYRRMVRNVDTVRMKEPALNVGKQLREVNAQLVEVGQVLFSVAAAFVFGYMAAAVAAGQADTGRRILCGLAAALVVLVAEGYFLIRYLSSADEPPPARPADKKRQ